MVRIPTRPDPGRDYLVVAPLPLAFERAVEARIFRDLPMERPVLDIGCGEGLFAKVVFAEPVDTGIDPDARELDRARELGSYAELIECFGHEIPKPDGSYATVMSNSVLEHIPDVESVLREAHRLLAPGGHMYVTVPSDRFEHYSAVARVLDALGLAGASRRFRSFYNDFWRHYHAYPVDGWRALAERCGFEVTEARAYNPRGMCLMNDLLVPFSAPGLVIKKLTNRWTLLPGLRRIWTRPVHAVMRGRIEGSVRADDGGLVFLALRRPE